MRVHMPHDREDTRLRFHELRAALNKDGGGLNWPDRSNFPGPGARNCSSAGISLYRLAPNMSGSRFEARRNPAMPPSCYGRVVTGGSTGFEACDRFARSTSNTRTGSVKPFAEMGGSAVSERVCSSSVATASETSIWPDLAAEHNRAARFTLRPMAV